MEVEELNTGQVELSLLLQLVIPRQSGPALLVGLVAAASGCLELDLAIWLAFSLENHGSDDINGLLRVIVSLGSQPLTHKIADAKVRDAFGVPLIVPHLDSAIIHRRIHNRCRIPSARVVLLVRARHGRRSIWLLQFIYFRKPEDADL